MSPRGLSPECRGPMMVVDKIMRPELHVHQPHPTPTEALMVVDKLRQRSLVGREGRDGRDAAGAISWAPMTRAINCQITLSKIISGPLP